MPPSTEGASTPEAKSLATKIGQRVCLGMMVAAMAAGAAFSTAPVSHYMTGNTLSQMAARARQIHAIQNLKNQPECAVEMDRIGFYQGVSCVMNVANEKEPGEVKSLLFNDEGKMVGSVDYNGEIKTSNNFPRGFDIYQINGSKLSFDQNKDIRVEVKPDGTQKTYDSGKMHMSPPPEG